jgi:signal transduction histidine kinase
MLGPLEDILAKSEDRVFADNRSLVTVAHRNAMRLLKLVNSLLDFSRIEADRRCKLSMSRPTCSP